MIGSKISWQSEPTKKFLGLFITLEKSSKDKPRPNPNMIRARAIGAIVVTISKIYPPFDFISKTEMNF